MFQLDFFLKIMWDISYCFSYIFDESLRVLSCPDLDTVRLFAMLFSKKTELDSACSSTLQYSSDSSYVKNKFLVQISDVSAKKFVKQGENIKNLINIHSISVWIVTGASFHHMKVLYLSRSQSYNPSTIATYATYITF